MIQFLAYAMLESFSINIYCNFGIINHHPTSSYIQLLHEKLKLNLPDFTEFFESYFVFQETGT